MIEIKKKQRETFQQYKKKKKREITQNAIVQFGGNGFVEVMTIDKLYAYDMLMQRKFISTVELALHNTKLDVFEQTEITTYIHTLLNS